MKLLKKNLLLIILLLAFFLRFGGLSWGLPYHFHPDEWNMAVAISQLSWKEKLHPHFFAYGQFPLYLSFFSHQIFHPLFNLNSNLTSQTAAFWLRFWSALASLGTIYFVFLITRQLLGNQSALIATFLTTFTPGLIQIAHFGTTESLLSFFFLAIIFFSLKVLRGPVKKKYYWLAALFLGLALGTKISAFVFCSSFFLVSFLVILREKALEKRIKILLLLFSALVLAFILALTISPYLVLDFAESKRILFYETQVALGQIPVFYTRQFLKTTPIIFQFQKIFPFALGWPIFILGTLGFFFSFALIIAAILKRKISNLEVSLLVLNLAFLTYFFSQAFLFCKWTRFMAPIFAFFPIFASLLLSRLNNSKLKFFLIGIAILPGGFFSTIYFRPDIRFQASEWIYKNIPSKTRVLSETANVVDLPVLPPQYPQFSLLTSNYSLVSTSFDFYHLDENPNLFPQLLEYLEKSDYILVPSRRVFVNHLRFPEKYPLVAKYYDLLFSGKLGFGEIKKFSPFDWLPATFSYFFFNDELAEETWSVFDHPVIRIYKKNLSLSQQQYEKLFKEN